LLFKHIAASNFTIKNLVGALNHRLREARLELKQEPVTERRLIGWQTHTGAKPSAYQFETLQTVLIQNNPAYSDSAKSRKLREWKLAYENYKHNGARFAELLCESIAQKDLAPKKLVEEFDSELRKILGVDEKFQHENITVDYLARVISGGETPSAATTKLFCKVLKLNDRDSLGLMGCARANAGNIVYAFLQPKIPGKYYLYEGAKDPVLNDNLNLFYRTKAKIIEVIGTRKQKIVRLSNTLFENNRRFPEIINANNSLAAIGNQSMDFLGTLEDEEIISRAEKMELSELFTQLKGVIAELRAAFKKIKNHEVQAIPQEHVHPNFDSQTSRRSRAAHS